MNAEEYYNLGQEKYKLKQYAEALEYYNKAIELDKDYERAFVQRAYCKAEAKDYKGALDDYKLAMSLNSNDPLTYLNAGFVAYQLDNSTEDTSYYDKAIELDSEQVPHAYFMRGMIYDKLGLYDKAIEDYTKALDVLDFNELYALRGSSYVMAEKYDKALDDYNRYLELVSVSDNFFGVCSAYYRMGYIKYLQGDYEQGLAYYKKTKELDPNFDNIDEEIEMCEEALNETFVKE